MIPALTPDQQIARLVEIARQNPRAKLLPALHEVQRGARLADLRGQRSMTPAAIMVDHIGQRAAVVAVISDLRDLEQIWNGAPSSEAVGLVSHGGRML